MIDLCPNCKQPKPGGSSGSLTQWIFVCHCSSLNTAVADEPDVDAYRFQICRKCRKRISSGRDGSLTQFVFRSDNCRCEQPEFLDVAIARSIAEASDEPVQPYDGPIVAALADDVAGLDLSPEQFPTNRFKPLRELGRGASGAVYLCVDRLLGTYVAVKTLHHLSQDQLLNFQQEARAISRLTHPNIVKILDFGATDSGIPYMVLEYIEGTDLASLVELPGAISLSEILEIMISMCDALSYSHSKQIFHRDLKPSNILIVRNKRLSAKLVDFGVARVKFEALEPTVCHGTTVIGTPAYMSPDQMRGISYDQRSEVYSLGCILFELLTGRQIFEAETVLEVVSLHVNAPIPLLSDVAPGANLPSQFDDILAKCLAKDPQDRYQNVDELKKDLESALSTSGAPTLPEPTEDSGDKQRSSQQIYTDAVLQQAFKQPSLDKETEQMLAEKEKKSPALRIVSILVSLMLLGGIGYAAFRFMNAPTASEEPKPLGGEFGSARLANTIMETKFNVNKFSGNYWLFNMGEVSDDCLPELLKSEHSSRLWIDQGSLSPQALRKLKPLHVIAFAIINMDLTNKHLEALTTLTTIKALRLFENPTMSDESLSYIKKMHNLQELFIRSDNVTDDGVAQLAELTNLEILSLDRCTKLTDKSIDMIAKLPKLKRLSVADTKITKQGILRIAKMRNLTCISVSKLPCDSECVRELAKIPPQRLSLRYADITQADIMRLCKLPSLILLDVRNTEINKKGEKEFLATRAASKLPYCRLLRERKVGVDSFGEMVYLTLDDEHMWVEGVAE